MRSKPLDRRRRRLSRRGGRVLLIAGVLAVHAAFGQRGPAYRYGEAWWDEYLPHGETILLFHFGAPQERAARRDLVAAVEQARDEEALFDLSLIPSADPLPIRIEGMDPAAHGRRPTIDPAAVPADRVQDYAVARRQPMLPDGMRKVDGGRFGAGLACSGGPGLDVRVDAPASVELHIRIDRLPERPQCVWSLADDESRLLLHPDGRLELSLRHPHGHPGTYPGLKEKPDAAQVAALRMRDAAIISPSPIAVGTWVHVRVYNHPHPTPGGGEPWDARLVIDGEEVAGYLSERYNVYPWLGRRETRFVLGNSAAGDAGFTGMLDEVRLLSRANPFYRLAPTPWRDADHALQFDRPWFRENATVFHASLDRQLAFDRPATDTPRLVFDLPPGASLDGIRVPGIRGSGWLIDPLIGFPRIPLDGMSAQTGALEFWLRPVNWDDVTGYWHHSPPAEMRLNVVRLLAADAHDALRPAMTLTLPRAHNLERRRIPLDPGAWVHVVAVWRQGRGQIYIDGTVHGSFRVAADLQAAPLRFAEFGIVNDVTVSRGEPPRIEIDEIAGYRQALRSDEVTQARRRWITPLDPIPLYESRLEYKWSIAKLDFALTPLLPGGVDAAAARASFYALTPSETLLAGPLRSESLDRDAFRFILRDGDPVLPGHYQVRFEVLDAAGTPVAEGRRDWHYAEEPWRHSRAGILDRVPPPWTPIERQDRRLTTRMTRYDLGEDGLPAAIHVADVNLLAAPFQLLEQGRVLPGSMTPGTAVETDVEWSATFTGRTVDIRMDCRLEYDGMIRYELHLTPRNGVVAPLTFRMPLQARHATHYVAYPAVARGPFTGRVDSRDGIVISSRSGRERRFDDARREWGFYTHAGLNDRDRGLWWFCDHAGGWTQSKDRGAVKIVRDGSVVALELNLIAEETADVATETPIVFGILPHPARPMPPAYRLYDRVAPEIDAAASSIYDAFRPWPRDPRRNSMQVYPAPDPRHPENGPSWAYAESCIPSMRSAKPHGLRTMYLSKLWFSCRAGAYDHWEWRSGENSGVSLTPSFVNYLSWEMNEWIGRGIWDAIYLDECYETPARNLEAGFSVRLPDGTEQPGVRNFDFRELMKRWRNIFHAHGRDPMLIAHLTYSWQYHGVVFADSYLDGENRPIVSLNSRDWIDSTSKLQFEVIQNGRMWGVSSFYMPYISEGGFGSDASRFPVWQWRMARQAQSQFAHYEVATVYEGQGSQVYKGYWQDVLGWGGGDPERAVFVPYWHAAPAIRVADPDGSVMLSYYRQPGSVLLIASNRAKTNATLHVALAFDALGLKPKPGLRSLDRTFDPPPGDDFLGAAAVTAEARSVMGRSVDDVAGVPAALDMLELEALLLGDDAVQERQRAEFEPTLEGNVLILPVRARDYRVIVLD